MITRRRNTAPVSPFPVPFPPPLPARRVPRVARLAARALACAAVVIPAAPASAAWVCELFATPPNLPGGEAPAAVLFTDGADAGPAEAACRARFAASPGIVAWYVREMKNADLPAAWKESDLLAKPGRPAATAKTGYVCSLYDKPSWKPSGDVPIQRLYADKGPLDEVVEDCRAAMRARVTSVDRNFQVDRVRALPAGWDRSALPR